MSTRHDPPTSETDLALAGLTSPALLNAPIAAYAVDQSGRICLFNHAAEALLGWTAEEVMGQLPPFVRDEDRDRAIEALEQVFADRPVVHQIFSPRHRDRTVFQALCSATIVRDAAGEPVAALTLVRDITTELAADELRRVAEHKWRQLALHTAEYISILDARGVVIGGAGSSIPPLGYSLAWWGKHNGLEVVHPDELSQLADDWLQLVTEPGRHLRRTYRVRHLEGHYELMEFTALSMFDDPVIRGVILTTRNVSAQQQPESLLADEARVLELIARDAALDDVLREIIRVVEYHTSGTCGIVLAGEESGAATMVTTAAMPAELCALAEKITVGPARTDPAGDTVTWGQDAMAVTDLVSHPLTADAAASMIELGINAMWTTPVVESRTATLYGLVVAYLGLARTPTPHEVQVSETASRLAAIAVERAGWQRELWEQARFDSLTGLPNRSLIFEELDDTLNRARAHDHPVTVMLIDLDRFKLINDSLGHQVGDHLITEFANRLRSTLGEDHFVGRVGADEFVTIFPVGVRIRDAQLAAARVAKSLEQPFATDGDEIYLTASIGIAMADSGHENAGTLVQQADAAMYRAKALGRDRTELFDEGLRTRAVARLQLDRDLRLALERKELVLHYQPEIDCGTGRIVGAEALLRWEHPDHGLIQPDGFIDLAEETGVIVPIGHWVLDEAVRQARTWTDRDPTTGPFAVSVNLSARQLINRSLVDTVAFVLTRYNWPPSLLTLELTESILIEDRDATLFVLNRLRLLGVKLSIDDFGTGFASLDYLHRLHVDSIKIDRSFVSMLDAAGNGSPVATAMMHMAQAFDLTVTAEGVEEVAQYDGLKALGCDLAQGFLFARPLPSHEMWALMESHPTW